MDVDSEEYWARRAIEREKEWHKKCQETLENELARYYLASLGHIQTDIAALYGRFAKDNALPIEEARKLITGREYRQWRMSIEEYIRKIKENGDKGLERELNVLAMRSRISRLDKLYSETLMELDALGRKVSTDMTDFLTDAYKDNYYHGLFDIGKEIGLSASFAKVNRDDLTQVLRNRWSGMNYSQRIWKNQRLLARTLKSEMMTAVHRGESIDAISKRVSQRMDTGISNARRLVRTELNYVENQSAMDSIKEAGMKYYRFSATLDRRTSTTCREHDGHVYELDEYQPGSTAPPLHPNCRSTISGSLYGPGKKKTGTRIARNDKGKTCYVPADMTYADWKSVYIDKKITLKEWENGQYLISIRDAFMQKAKPGGGGITYDQGYRKSRHQEEFQVANWLKDNFGGNIHLVNEKTKFTKSPDYLWNEKKWDLKTVTTVKSVDSALRHGIKQIEDNPGGIILNFPDDKTNLINLEKAIIQRMRRSAHIDAVIIVLQAFNLVDILQYKKKKKQMI